MSNLLQYETSPYLRQHAENPVNWYPWGEAAFERAREEDKPVFLSVGYSTCHWCHVMARESFEDPEIAALLNRDFIAVKVDREERADIDNLYMRVCQAFTGAGGWPMSIFMTPDQRPFFAGTYYPPHSRRGSVGLKELLTAIREQWDTDRDALLERADAIVSHLSHSEKPEALPDLPEIAVRQFARSFDRRNGGFGQAPKFPAPHNLLFLLNYGSQNRNASCLEMADRTLMQMYRGGLFDHIGGGFSRYSTDERFLAPHFEKMLYDNALLILAYCRAHEALVDRAHSALYLRVAERTADFILREMTLPEGGFAAAQDADSEGEEGKYYLFTPKDIHSVLPQAAAEDFCRVYDVTERGNFAGKSIPNLLSSDPLENRFERELDLLRRYRRERHPLHLDDKVLTAWNALCIAALCALYCADGNEMYLQAALNADRFLRGQAFEGGTLHAGVSAGRRGAKAFLDDYAAYVFAQLALYRATFRREYLESARDLCRTVQERFSDPEAGGFFFTPEDGETLVLRPKETYDGAMPSGNSLMTWNLTRLSLLTGEEEFGQQAERQIAYMSAEASAHPAGHAMFLCALLDAEDPPLKAVVVSEDPKPDPTLVHLFPWDTAVTLRRSSAEFPLVNGRTTYYVCSGQICYPPVNDPEKREWARQDARVSH